jgi:5-methylcytosine-specific restriction endonuclease McrA
MKDIVYPTAIYPSNWRKVSAVIRRLAHGHCEWCHSHTNRLTVHHIGIPYADGRPGNPHDKHDLRRENLVALCWPCHSAVDHIHIVRREKVRRQQKRLAKVARHRALGVGVGLVVYGERAA